MKLAKKSAWLEMCKTGGGLFSTCSRRQYMAIIVDTAGRVAGVGYNGAPSGMQHCVDGGCPRGSSRVEHGAPYEGNCVAIHAEVNAILHGDVGRMACGVLVVNGPPCWNCAVMILGTGLREVVCVGDGEYGGWPKVRELLRGNGVRVTELEG